MFSAPALSHAHAPPNGRTASSAPSRDYLPSLTPIRGGRRLGATRTSLIVSGRVIRSLRVLLPDGLGRAGGVAAREANASQQDEDCAEPCERMTRTLSAHRSPHSGQGRVQTGGAEIVQVMPPG